PRSWALWRQPRALIRYFLAAEAVAVGLTGYLATRTHPTWENWWQLGVLVGMALVQAEASRKIERARRLIANAPHVNVASVWLFAGVVLLPPALVGVLVIVVYTHLWARIWRTMGTRPAHRVLFSTAIALLSVYTAAGAIAAGRVIQQANGWFGSAPTVAVVLAGSL